MAKARTIIRQIPARMPAIRIAVPRAVAAAKHHGRRFGRRVVREASENKHRLLAMGAAFGLGLLDKSGISLPEIPVLGKAGTLAVACYFGARAMHSRALSHAATGLACVALYELGSQGSISGDVLGGVATQT